MSGSGSVIMIYGLTPGKHNCESVFNLLCSYGNILKVNAADVDLSFSRVCISKYKTRRCHGGFLCSYGELNAFAVFYVLRWRDKMVFLYNAHQNACHNKNYAFELLGVSCIQRRQL